MSEVFAGDNKKHLNHFLRNCEVKLIKASLPLVPAWIGTVNLTLMTLLWSALIILFGYLAVKNIHWLWGFSACIFLQHLTDMLDGEIGRRRNTGLIKWGFYMDHLLDYGFLCSILIGYSFLLPPSYDLLILFCLTFSGGFMVHVLMDFAITDDFKISFNRFGVAETRYILILFNVVLIFFGKELLSKVFPLVVLIFLAALFFVVYTSQKIYRYMDLGRKKQESESEGQDI